MNSMSETNIALCLKELKILIDGICGDFVIKQCETKQSPQFKSITHLMATKAFTLICK